MTDAIRRRARGVARERRALPRGLLRIAALSALACAVPHVDASAQTARQARSTGLSVSVKPARKMCFEDSVQVTGTLVPRQELEIGPDREGLQVAQVLVEPLDEVTPGQILARLSPPEGQGSATPIPVRSSVAGIVGRSWALAGTPATTRQPLFQVIVGGELDLQAEVPVADLAKLQSGQPVTITPLGLPDLSGKVTAIGSSLDPASQLGRIRIAISNGRTLRVGTFARGLIVVARRCGIGVPYSSVMYETDGTIVHVVAGDRVQARKVTIGLLSGNDIEVQSGLADAEFVVTRAGPFLRDGEQVSPIKPGEPGSAPTR